MVIGRLAAIILTVSACTLHLSCTDHGRSGSDREPVGSPQIPVVDTHIDAPTQLLARWTDLGELAPDREFDYPRAREGGLDVAFMSIYTSAEDAAEGRARQVAHHQIDAVEALVARHPERFTFLRSPREVPLIRKSGKIMFAFGMENAAPIGNDPKMLEVFFHHGVRYLILAHSVSNEYADSSYDSNRRWHGLSPLGRRLVKEMNRLGMMVDISHLSDESVAEAIALSYAPVIASHTAMRHFTPGFERNISDELAKAVAAKGGVVQIAFGTNIIDAHGAENMQASYQAHNVFDARNSERIAEGLPPKDRARLSARNGNGSIPKRGPIWTRWSVISTMRFA